MGGFNPYGYVGIPTAFVDPLGLELKQVIFPPNKVYADVKIKLQGGRKADYKAANIEAGILNTMGVATQTSHQVQYGEVTWHHVDYDPVTNEARMQLVSTEDHVASLPHKGSVKDFESTHGVDYDTPAAKAKAKSLNDPKTQLISCKGV